jgi:hypothetical protein
MHGTMQEPLARWPFTQPLVTTTAYVNAQDCLLKENQITGTLPHEWSALKSIVVGVGLCSVVADV